MLLRTGQMSESNQGQRVRRAQKRIEKRQRGAAIVEFAMVMILLFTLVFGIIGFGVVMSFKQTLTHAAAEAARRAATTQDDPLTTSVDERLQVANSAIDEFEGWGRTCADMQVCTVTIHDCNLTPLPLNANNTVAGKPDCITATLVYDYANNPILPNLPFVGIFMPDLVATTATSQLTFPTP